MTDRLGHRIPIEELIVDGTRVLIVHVPSRLPGTAWNINGRYLKRAGDELTALSDAELREIFAETGPDFSAELCPNATVGDLAETAIVAFRERWARKSRDDRKLGWSNIDTLVNAELIWSSTQITYAAFILFGTRQALGRYLAQAELVFEYRPTDASGPAADREEYREGFFLWQELIWNKINLRNTRQSYQEGLFRMDLPTFDEVAVREALLNAVAHRDYRLGGSIFIRQFPSRLEIVSPGGFPAGITTENILDQQNPRNRRLAEALAKCGLIERSGQGMNLMFESSIRQGKPLPNFSGTSQHEVRLSLEGVVQSPAFVRFIERIGEETLRAFSTYDFLVLDAIHREKQIPEYLRSRLPALASSGIVETQGRGRGTRYLLSRRFFSALGASASYTRRRGLDHQTNKALLEQHLRNKGSEGAPLAELEQVLPALPERAAQRLLNELRNEGRIRLSGQRRWARWFIETS